MSNILESLSPAEILTLTIIGEARGEPIEGQVAVGCVVRNRMLDNPGKYKTLADVCLEKLQFSCWNEHDPNRPFLLELANKMMMGQILDPHLKQCQYVANGIYNWSILDNTNGAVNYMTAHLFHSDKRPKWAAHPINDIVVHGRQIFFSV